MQAGFAEITITPPGGECLLAGYALYPATAVHDDLYANAIYLADDTTQATLISFDLLAMEKELIGRLKSAVSAAVSIDPAYVFLTCTHTHEGPEVRERKFRDRWTDEDRPDYLDGYLDYLCTQTATVAEAAKANAQPCDLIANRTFVDENLNRRFFLSNEQYLSVPGNKHLAPIAHEHADKELGIIGFCAKGTRRPFGLLLNYTMHPLTAGHTSASISADVPGVVRRLVKESMECLTCYVTGAAGDNHPKAPEAGFAETERVGNVLATEAIKRVYDAFRLPGELKVRGVTRSIPLRLRTREEFEQIPLNGQDEGVIAANLRRVEDPGAIIDVEFSLLAIGPILLIGVPGELVAELGSVLKWLSPFKRTYVMYQATDSLDYLAHPNAYLWGGFETLCGQLSPSAIRPFINAVLDAAEELSTEVSQLSA